MSVINNMGHALEGAVKITGNSAMYGAVGYALGWAAGKIVFKAAPHTFGLTTAASLFAKTFILYSIDAMDWDEEEMSKKMYLKTFSYAICDTVTIVALVSLGLIGTPGIILFGTNALFALHHNLKEARAVEEYGPEPMFDR